MSQISDNEKLPCRLKQSELALINKRFFLETKLPSEKQIEGGSGGGGVQTFGICIFLFLLLP